MVKELAGGGAVAVAVVLVTDDNGSGQVIGDSQITKKYIFLKSKSVK